MNMEITNVRINKYEKGKLLGFVDLEFDGCMTWKGCKLFSSRDGGVFVSLPSQPDRNGKKNDKGEMIYYPVISLNVETDEGKEIQDRINKTVYEHWKSMNNSNQKPSGRTSRPQLKSTHNTPEDKLPF